MSLNISTTLEYDCLSEPNIDITSTKAPLMSSWSKSSSPAPEYISKASPNGSINPR